MNISLTDIEYFPKLSEETCCFSAVLCVDGVKVANVKNHGTGGCHFYYAIGFMNEYNQNKETLELLKQWAVSLEPKVIQEYNISLTNDLDFVVDDMLEKWFDNVKLKVVNYSE
jgi:ribosome-binding factor A